MNEGRYVYCVVDTGEITSLGKIGIEYEEVYTISCEDLSAVVQNCPLALYASKADKGDEGDKGGRDEETVKGWVMDHQRVIDVAKERLGTVLPLGFGTIITGGADAGSEENVRKWLKEDYDTLKRKLEKVRGKEEFGVQVFWNPKAIIQESGAIKEKVIRTILDAEMRSKSRGIAYMYKQKLEMMLKREMEVKADECFKDFYNRIKKHADDLRVEKTKEAGEEGQMLMNLSCLVSRDKYSGLGEELEKINSMDGFSVRFTGPWPPYSFVT